MTSLRRCRIISGAVKKSAEDPSHLPGILETDVTTSKRSASPSVCSEKCSALIRWRMLNTPSGGG